MKLGVHVSHHAPAQAAYEEIKKTCTFVPPEEADIIIVLGGDGTMLRALHKYTGRGIPFFGLNLGTLGFLMNEYTKADLVERLQNIQSLDIHPLRMIATDTKGKQHELLAYNEVSLLRETHSSAKLMIFVNDEIRLPLLVCDGAIVCTPVGSTAYNSSAYGPILPLNANIMPITAISAFRPRRWPGALVPDTSRIRFEVIKPHERPVSASADYTEIRDIITVEISVARDITQTLLFDPDNHLEERIYQEQFAS